MTDIPGNPITEDWLREVGFKWNTVGDRPAKHWTLWMGHVANDEPGQIWNFHDDEDLGLELANGGDFWFCWLRGDTSHRYSRFLHIRHVRRQSQVIQLVEALSGAGWKPENHLYGKIFTTEQVERIRDRDKRLDVRIAKASPWSEREKDDSAGRKVGEGKSE